MVSEKTRALRRALLSCDKKRVLCSNTNCESCFNKSLASTLPKTIKIADNNIDPRHIQKYSQKKLLFECNICCHEFDKKIMAITTGDQCTYCTSKPITLCDKDNCAVCFEKSFASHKKSKCWDFEKNDLLPRQFHKGSIQKIWCICDTCNHSFETTPKLVVDGHFCPYCANLKMCDDFKCMLCYQKSFATHPFAVNWSFKNNALPWEVFKGSTSQKYYFDCKICNHELYMVLGSIDENTLNCIYCASKKLCINENCEPCFNKSFASNSFSEYWSPKNKVNPRNVLNKTQNEYLFNCRICKHDIKIPPSRINEDKINCIYCASLKLCDIKDCNSCFNKSFASHEKVIYWSKKNKVKPRDVFKGTNNKYLFNCNYCKGEFTSSLSQISRGSWCNLCVNKTEKMLKEWLVFKYGIENIIQQHKVMDGEKKYFYDFYLPNLDLIIELDGLQHFEQVGNWKSPEHALHNDIAKINLAIKNNKSMIRILQEDVFYNRNNWEEKLTNSIKKYDTLSCIFINDDNNIYQEHINECKTQLNTIVV